MKRADRVGLPRTSTVPIILEAQGKVFQSPWMWLEGTRAGSKGYGARGGLHTRAFGLAVRVWATWVETDCWVADAREEDAEPSDEQPYLFFVHFCDDAPANFSHERSIPLLLSTLR